MLLTVAVLTFRRPRDLAAILPLLVQQAIAVRSSDLDVEVLVVDNDPTGGARSQVSEISKQCSTVPVRYENEVTAGISAARNKALDSAEESDLLVFIDDDERPQEQWLANLLGSRLQFGADVVVGPVISEFDVIPEPWIQAGEFFKRRRMPTGSTVTVAATNNLLLDLRVVRAATVRFDLDFGLTGGDDTMFTRQLSQSGACMVWCDEAIVVDVVPAHRTTRKWVLLRAFSSGNTWSLVDLKLQGSSSARQKRRVFLVLQGSIRLAGGTLMAVVGFVLFSRRRQAKGCRTACRGFGMLAGAFGYKFEEYKR